MPHDAQDAGWEQQRLFFHYDPAPALAAMRCPVLALFGAKDSGIPVEKNRSRWQEALTRGGHRDHALIVVPGANHIMFEAESGSMFEISSLNRFVPDYRRIPSTGCARGLVCRSGYAGLFGLLREIRGDFGSKMGVRDRTRAVLKVIEAGLIRATWGHIPHEFFIKIMIFVTLVVLCLPFQMAEIAPSQ